MAEASGRFLYTDKTLRYLCLRFLYIKFNIPKTKTVSEESWLNIPNIKTKAVSEAIESWLSLPYILVTGLVLLVLHKTSTMTFTCTNIIVSVKVKVADEVEEREQLTIYYFIHT